MWRMSTFNININFEGDKLLKSQSLIPYPCGPRNIEKGAQNVTKNDKNTLETPYNMDGGISKMFHMHFYILRRFGY